MCPCRCEPPHFHSTRPDLGQTVVLIGLPDDLRFSRGGAPDRLVSCAVVDAPSSAARAFEPTVALRHRYHDVLYRQLVEEVFSYGRAGSKIRSLEKYLRPEPAGYSSLSR